MEGEDIEDSLPETLGNLEKRDYQVNMYKEVREGNSLLVLPTGLGKTVVALFLISEKIEKLGGPIFFLAPSKPLCEQHSEILQENLETNVKVVTGETHNPDEREKIWKSSEIFVATPQTVRNDLQAERLSLENCPLIVFDEAHRATGDYSYVGISKIYRETADSSQVLGLTASPGNDLDSLREVVRNLGLERISIRDETDPDVKPYVGKKFIEKVELEKTPPISRAEKALNSIIEEALDFLSTCSEKAKEIEPRSASPKDLKEVMNSLQSRLENRKSRRLYRGVSRAAAAIKLSHLKRLVTTQGFEPASKFVDELEREDTKASSCILRHPSFTTVRQEIKNARQRDFPKVQKAMEILGRHLGKHTEGRAMVFTEYRSTVELLKRELSRELIVEPETLIGQAESDGMTQKEQKETLNRFEGGEFNTLVSTRIGEEGIDVPTTSLVLFYEPIPSAVRRIQRKGRTARDGRIGEVKILVMENTQDEPYYWMGIRGERKLYQKAREFGNALEEKKKPSLEDFA